MTAYLLRVKDPTEACETLYVGPYRELSHVQFAAELIERTTMCETYVETLVDPADISAVVARVE